MKKLKKSAAVTLTLVLGAGMSLAACAKKDAGTASPAPTTGATTTAPKEKVTIDYWTWWASETRRPIIEKIINDFNASQDHIVVKHTTYPFGDIWTKELAQVAAGNPPDVVMNSLEEVGVRAQKKQVESLAKYIAKDKDVANRFYPELWNAVQYKGEPYGIPFAVDTRMMFYNKTAFKEAGLDPEKFPDTWDELEQDAIKLDKKGADGKYERIGYAPQFAGFDPEAIAVNFDGGKNWIDSNGNAAVNTQAKIDGFNYVNKYTNRLGLSTLNEFKAAFGSKQANPFLAGKLAIYPDAMTFYTQIRDYAPQGFDWGVAPIPEVKSGAGHWSVSGGFVAEIPKGAKHPDEAWEFIKYLTDKSSEIYWSQKNYDISPNKEAAESAELAKDPVLKAAADNMKWSKSYIRPVYAADYGKLVDAQRDAILLQKESPKDGLDKAQKDVADLIAQNGGPTK